MKRSNPLASLNCGTPAKSRQPLALKKRWMRLASRMCGPGFDRARPLLRLIFRDCGTGARCTLAKADWADELGCSTKTVERRLGDLSPVMDRVGVSHKRQALLACNRDRHPVGYGCETLVYPRQIHEGALKMARQLHLGRRRFCLGGKRWVPWSWLYRMDSPRSRRAWPRRRKAPVRRPLSKERVCQRTDGPPSGVPPCSGWEDPEGFDLDALMGGMVYEDASLRLDPYGPEIPEPWSMA